MPVLKQKLVMDFFEATAVDRNITKGTILLEDGIVALKEMIQFVKDDIKTLDEKAYEELEKKSKELTQLNIQHKDKIRERMKTITEDSIDERNLKRKLLKEDQNRYKRELVLIMNLCYNKGWFD